MGPLDWLKRRGIVLFGIGALALTLGLNWQKALAVAASTASPKSAQASERPVPRGVHAEGRLVTYPGGLVTVGTDIGGTLKSLPVLEKAHVKKGELLAEIDASEQSAALNEARVRVREAEVDMKLFDVELQRSERLFRTDAVAKDTVDRSEHDLDAAKARRESAAATAYRLGTVVRKTRIVSPIDGVVTARLAEAGETVAPGAQLVTVADLTRTRIEAEVDEYDSGRIALGDAVTIQAEGFSDHTWRGTVEEIPDEVTSRRLKPQDPGRPSDTRVLLVKVALAEATPVKLGQRVEVEIYTAR